MSGFGKSIGAVKYAWRIAIQFRDADGDDSFFEGAAEAANLAAVFLALFENGVIPSSGQITAFSAERGSVVSREVSE